MRAIDYTLLENRLYFTQSDNGNAVLSVRAADLLHKPEMDRFIRTYMTLIKALEPAVAGTYFSGWLRFVCLVQQYAVSICDTALDLSLSNLTIRIYPKDRYYSVSFKCNELRTYGPPAGGRERWREEVFTTLYRDQIRPLLETVSQSTQANVGRLWGQFPSVFQYYLDMFKDEAEDDAQRVQIADDYRFLSERLDGAVFGRKKNPFDVKFRMLENPREPGKCLRMKTSCCMYYRTEGGHHCYTCPRLTEEGREERKAQLLVRAKA